MHYKNRLNILLCSKTSIEKKIFFGGPVVISSLRAAGRLLPTLDLNHYLLIQSFRHVYTISF